MRITQPNNAEFSTQQSSLAKTAIAEKSKVDITLETTVGQVEFTSNQASSMSQETLKEKLAPAVDMMNEVLQTTNKSSKFILHEGLDKYFVRLVDAQTEEVIKEIPPQRLLDAFYELQKLTGMIVDEKI